jgi:hypothetical protein
VLHSGARRQLSLIVQLVIGHRRLSFAPFSGSSEETLAFRSPPFAVGDIPYDQPGQYGIRQHLGVLMPASTMYATPHTTVITRNTCRKPS